MPLSTQSSWLFPSCSSGKSGFSGASIGTGSNGSGSGARSGAAEPEQARAKLAQSIDQVFVFGALWGLAGGLEAAGRTRFSQRVWELVEEAGLRVRSPADLGAPRGADLFGLAFSLRTAKPRDPRHF